MLRRGVEIRKVVICTERVDMRKGIDGLVALIRLRYNLNPLEKGTLFLFCGRKKDRLKAVLFEGDGFVLAYKRLSCGRYRWPKNAQEARELTLEEYDRLMEGFEIDSSIRAE